MNNLSVSNIDMLIPHQANLRISQFIQKKFGLNDDQVYNNIQKIREYNRRFYSNCFNRSLGEWKIKSGDTVVLAFGSGFTWGSAIIRWY
jgi:3-oxoacyl-[acyl-carrier-protein] synthase-3